MRVGHIKSKFLASRSTERFASKVNLFVKKSIKTKDFNNTSLYCNSGSQFSAPSQSYASSYNIQSSQTVQSLQHYNFSGSTATVPGLGLNESLRPTTCPTAVHNPEGGQVLGCYNVVKPVPQTTYYRVVRPIIYVRYPVPTPVVVPTYNRCSGAGFGGYGHARYGHGHSHQAHHNGHGYRAPSCY